MKKAEKGTYGYTDAHKRAQLRKTLLYFLLPAAIFILGLATTKTKSNYFTIVAVVGCLPACKELVNVILFWKRKSLTKELYQELSSHTEGMKTAYELVLTTYERNYPIPCMVICGNETAGWMDAQGTDARKAEEHIRKTLKANGLNVHVHIFQEKKAFLDRVDALAAKAPEEPPFTPDERYPGLGREDLIRELILALSL